MVMRVLLLMALTSAPAAAQSSAGRIAAVRGSASVEHPHAGGAVENASIGATVHEGDVLHTDPNSSLRLSMKDRGVIDLGAETKFVITAYQVAPKKKERIVQLRLLAGRMWA